VPFLTVPEGWFVLPEDARETPAAADAYREFAVRLSTDGPPHIPWRGTIQLLGHAVTVQGEDPRFAGPWLLRDDFGLRDPRAWRVLLNIDDGYEGMSFGDGGAPRGRRASAISSSDIRFPEHRAELHPPYVVTFVAEPMRKPDVVGREATWCILRLG